MIRVAADKIDVTPTENIYLGCNGKPDQKSTGIDSSIEINGVILECDEEMVIMLSFDTLFIPSDLKQSIIDKISSKNNIKEINLFVGASHTHYAPYLDENKKKIGRVSKKYKASLIKRSAKLCENLLNNSKVPCLINYCEGAIDGVAVNRRKKIWSFRRFKNIISIFPNHKEYINKKLSFISFVDEIKGNNICHVWFYACHPVAYHSPSQISSHFSGYIRESIRKKEKNIPVLYFQGFSGDVRPLNTPKRTGLKGSLVRLIYGADNFANFTKKTYLEWVECLINKIKEIRKKYNKRQLFETLELKLIKIPVKKFFKGKSPETVLYMHKIQLNKEIVIIGVSAEVVSEYHHIAKKEINDKNTTLISAGCINGMFGYLPTEKITREEGYEGKEFLKSFNLSGELLKNDIEEVVRKAFWRIITNKSN